MVKNRAFWAYNRFSTVILRVFGVINSDFDQWTILVNTQHTRPIFDIGQWFYGLMVPFWAILGLGTGEVQAVLDTQFRRLPGRNLFLSAPWDMCRLSSYMVTNPTSLIIHLQAVKTLLKICWKCVKNVLKFFYTVFTAWKWMLSEVGLVTNLLDQFWISLAIFMVWQYQFRWVSRPWEPTKPRWLRCAVSTTTRPQSLSVCPVGYV